MFFLSIATLLAAEPAPLVRQVPHHEVTVLADCRDDQLVAVVQEIQVAISLGAPAYNSGDHEACYRVYANAAVALDRRLKKCTAVRKALVAGITRADGVDGFTAKAWAMRDAFDGVLDVIARKAGPQAGTHPPKRQLPARVLDSCPADERRLVWESLEEAIDLGAPVYNEGRREACYRLYLGTAQDLVDSLKSCSGLKAELAKGIADAKTGDTVAEKAFTLRGLFDAIREVIERGRTARTNEL